MSSYLTSVDIANRGLQHCGVSRITSFDDDAKAASETLFVYDKLRQSELRRNVWINAIRKVTLRPIDTATLLLAPAAWSIASTYLAGQVVLHDSVIWQAKTATLAADEPGVSTSWDTYFGPMTANAHDADTTYGAGEIVFSGLSVYLSLTSANDATPPTAAWVSLGLKASITTALSILYPVGAGPSSQLTTLNVYRLPNGYLRTAPDDPKQGSYSPLGGPSNAWSKDWNLENGYIVSATSGPIFLRFVADTTFVPTFDPMFCEGLAARIALAVCETLTQSSEKLSNIGAQYKLFMGEARLVNAIEAGPTQPVEDDWVTARY